MKTIVCLAVWLVLVALTHAQPVHDETLGVDAPDTLAKTTIQATELHLRQKRATCDLLSAFNVNNSACALHCIARQFKGGYCNDKAVCVCRH